VTQSKLFDDALTCVDSLSSEDRIGPLINRPNDTLAPKSGQMITRHLAILEPTRRHRQSLYAGRTRCDRRTRSAAGAVNKGDNSSTNRGEPRDSINDGGIFALVGRDACRRTPMHFRFSGWRLPWQV
jgi:hypothetical protein